MSKVARTSRITTPDIRARKGGEPIVCLTSISMPTAKLLDPHCDLLLVGDSLGMVFYGMDSTVGVTLDMMIAHGAATMRTEHGRAHPLSRQVLREERDRPLQAPVVQVAGDEPHRQSRTRPRPRPGGRCRR